MANSFQARFKGKCANPECKRGRVINTGDYITWDRKKKGATMHVECMESYKVETKPYESPYLPNNMAKSEDFMTNAQTEQAKDDLMHDNSRQSESLSQESKESKDSEEQESESQDNLAKAIASAIKKYQERPEMPLDEKRIIELVKEHSSRASVVEITLTEPKTLDVKHLGKQHHMMPLLLQVLGAKDANGYSLNVWLTGPAGSGKTTAARICAESLNKTFYFTGAMDNQYGLSGFINAAGAVVRTPFRECYENGGVFLWDEVDACSPNALLWANAALANHHCAFPDAIVPRHKDCIVIAAANTWGLGANNDYVGRMKLDAAFIDRFVQIAWDIDEALESETCGNVGWSHRVQAVRAAVKAKGMKVVISPRSSYYGSALLASGIDIDDVEKMTLRKAMTDDQWASVKDSQRS